MAKYEVTLRFTKEAHETPVTIKTKTDVDEEDVKDILTQFVENPDAQTYLRNSFGLNFVIEKVTKRHL